MSIAYELSKPVGKKPCPPGSRAKRCPMILNETSEDLLTGNVFGLLNYLSPSIWLTPLLRIAFKGRNFNAIDRCTPKIDFWKKLPAPPTTRNREGTEEVDIVIRIRRLVILIECKYRSAIQPGHPTNSRRDQIIRYLDAAAFHYWPTREIYLVLLTDTSEEPVILSQYRNPQRIFEGLTQTDPFVDYDQLSNTLARNIGWATWQNLSHILKMENAGRSNPIETRIVGDLIRYLEYKLSRDYTVETTGSRGNS